MREKSRSSPVPQKLYRVVHRDYTDAPLPSRSNTGRFHTEKGSATYLVASPETAWKEVLTRFQAKRESFRMIAVEVKTGELKVADLTDPSIQSYYGVDTSLLTDANHAACQQLAIRLRADGFHAIWTYSRADYPDGRVLIVFLDVIDVERIFTGIIETP